MVAGSIAQSFTEQDFAAITSLVGCLAVGYGGGMTYLAFCKETAKEKVEALKTHSVSYLSLAAGAATSYLVNVVG